MADLKISQLPAVSTMSGSDLIPVVKGGVTSKITLTNFLTLTSQTLAQTLVNGNVTGGTNLKISNGDYITSANGLSTIDMGSGSYIQATSSDGSFIHIVSGVELTSPLGKEVIIYDGVFVGVPTNPGIWIDNNTFYTIHGSLTASKALVLGANKELQTSATSATQLGYLSSATGTTGTTSTNLVFSESPTFTGTPVLNTASATSLAITGTAGAGFLELKNQNAVPSTPTTALRLYSDNSNRFNILDVNGYSATFDMTGNSASRVYTFPNYNGTLATLAGTETLSAKTLTSPLISNSVGSAAGSIEYDGLVFYSTPLSGARGVSPSVMYAIVEAGDFALSTSTGVQSAFPSDKDVWTLNSNTTYYFEAVYYITKGGTSSAIAVAFALSGGASVTSILYYSQGGLTNASAYVNGIITVSSTQVTSTSSGNQVIHLKGIIRMNVGGSVTPQINLLSAGVTSPVMKAGSYIMFTPIGTDTNNTVGNVA